MSPFMAKPRRENPFLIVIVFLVLTAALAYFLILVWESPSPAQSNVHCTIDPNVFLGTSIAEDQVCAPKSYHK